MWIISTILWRFPFYLRGPLNFGFGPYGGFTLQTILEESNNSVFFLPFIISAVFLFIFLSLQDRYFFQPGHFRLKRTIYGFILLIGNLLIVFFGLFRDISIINNYLFFYMPLMLLWKVGVTPLVGMVIAVKIFKAEKSERYPVKHVKTSNP